MNANVRAAGAIKNPHIKTALPGPKSRAMIERDTKVTSPSYPRDYPFVMSHGKGTEAWDVDGNRFLDFAAGIAVCATGHAHPQRGEGGAGRRGQVPAHLERLLARGVHLAVRKALGARADERAGHDVPLPVRHRGGRGRAEARALRHRRGRASSASSAASTAAPWARCRSPSSKYTQQAGFFPTMPGVTHVPYPNPYRPLFAGADQGKAVLDYIEHAVRAATCRPREVAAIVIEPMQGEGGYLVPPPGFLAGLRAALRRARHPARVRRGAVRRRPHRQDVLRASTRA